MEEKKVLTTIEEVKALSDPFRYRILMTFNKIHHPVTIKEIATAMNEVPANVHYHVKKMEAAGILKLVYTKEIRGIIAKYYEPTAENFEIKCAPELDTTSKELMLGERQRMLSQIYDESKNIFMEQLLYSSRHDEKTSGTISMENIYLDDAEIREFEEYIQDFINKHKRCPENTSGINKLHFFISLYNITNEK